MGLFNIPLYIYITYILILYKRIWVKEFHREVGCLWTSNRENRQPEARWPTDSGSDLSAKKRMFTEIEATGRTKRERESGCLRSQCRRRRRRPCKQQRSLTPGLECVPFTNPLRNLVSLQPNFIHCYLPRTWRPRLLCCNVVRVDMWAKPCGGGGGFWFCGFACSSFEHPSGGCWELRVYPSHSKPRIEEVSSFW